MYYKFYDTNNKTALFFLYKKIINFTVLTNKLY
nr:MAG TPA: hypothetical protein [Caudoviricetes sp.]